MKEATFLKRCKQLAGDTSAKPWLAENLAGFFQGFRPDGAGLEPLFAKIPAGDEVLARLLQVFQAANTPPPDPNHTDGYFIVRKPAPATDKQLAALASAQLNNWRQMGEELEEVEFLQDESAAEGADQPPAGAGIRSERQ